MHSPPVYTIGTVVAQAIREGSICQSSSPRPLSCSAAVRGSALEQRLAVSHPGRIGIIRPPRRDRGPVLPILKLAMQGKRRRRSATEGGPHLHAQAPAAQPLSAEGGPASAMATRAAALARGVEVRAVSPSGAAPSWPAAIPSTCQSVGAITRKA
jgi:hypothetical protein